MLGRSREQLRFDTNRIVAILKEHEKILVDGFDQSRFCKIKKRRASSNPNSHQIVRSNVNQTNVSNSSLSSMRVPVTTTSASPTFDEPTSEPNYLRLVENTTPRSHLQQPSLDPTAASPSSVTEKETVVSTPLQINLEFRNEEELSCGQKITAMNIVVSLQATLYSCIISQCEGNNNKPFLCFQSFYKYSE